MKKYIRLKYIEKYIEKYHWGYSLMVKRLRLSAGTIGSNPFVSNKNKAFIAQW